MKASNFQGLGDVCRSSVFPGIIGTLSSSPTSLTTKCHLDPKNQFTEISPRAARLLKTQWEEIRVVIR